jgi:hypothetical protein
MIFSHVSTSYAIRLITKLAFATSIDGVGVTAGSDAVASTYLIETLKQHPLGTVIIAVDVTFPNSSTADGVNIAREEFRVSPFTDSAIPTGVIAPPVGIDIFPLKTI